MYLEVGEFEKKNFRFGNNIVNYIEKVYEIESAKPNMLRLAPKLTKQHIELPAFSKMKVKRAAQIFSNTVQAAMMTYVLVICHKKRIIRQLL